MHFIASISRTSLEPREGRPRQRPTCISRPTVYEVGFEVFLHFALQGAYVVWTHPTPPRTTDWPREW